MFHINYSVQRARFSLLFFLLKSISNLLTSSTLSRLSSCFFFGGKYSDFGLSFYDSVGKKLHYMIIIKIAEISVRVDEIVCADKHPGLLNHEWILCVLFSICVLKIHGDIFKLARAR